jgi:hypothetical protein
LLLLFETSLLLDFQPIMKKLLIPILFVAAFLAIYEQAKPRPNVYITVAAIVVFMFSMMRLSAKTPSKNQDNDDEHV